MHIQKWKSIVALAFALTACGGGGGHSKPAPPEPSPVDNSVSISGHASLSDGALSGADIRIGEIDVTQTSSEVTVRQEGKIIEVTTTVTTTKPTVSADGGIAMKIDGTKLDDAKLYRVEVKCPTRTENCSLTLPMSAVMSGARLKQGRWTVSVITEAVFQRLSYYVRAAYEAGTIQATIDSAASVLLKTDLDGSSTIDSEDLLMWDASMHQGVVKRPTQFAEFSRLLREGGNNNEVNLAGQALTSQVVATVPLVENTNKAYYWFDRCLMVGRYAFAAWESDRFERSGIKIIDAEKTSSPVVAVYDAGDEFGISEDSVINELVSGSLAYIFFSSGKLIVYDLVAQEIPTLIAELEDYNADSIIGNRVYAAANEQGIEVRDYPSMAFVTQIDTPGDANDVAVSDLYVFVADGSNGLQIIDATKREIISSLPLQGRSTRIEYYSNGFVQIHSSVGPYVIDVSSPAAPKLITNDNSSSYSCHILGVDRSALSIIENEGGITDPSVETIKVDGSVKIQNELTYVFNGSLLSIIDLRNPGAPKTLGQLSISGSYFEISGTSAYVVSSSEGAIKVIDVADSSEPRLIDVWRPAGFNDEIDLTAGNNYVAWLLPGFDDDMYSYTSENLTVFNYAATPPTSRILDVVGDPSWIKIDGDYAFVSHNRNMACDDDPERCEGFGIDIFDFAIDSIGPLKTISFLWDITAAYSSFAVAGSHVYVADGHNGLRIIDISSAGASDVSLKTHGYASSVYVVGNYAYLADNSGLQVIDIATPSTPKILGTISTSNKPVVGEINGYLFLSTGDGLEVHRTIPK